MTFEEIYTEHRTLLLNTAHRYVHCLQESRDVIQNSYFRTLKSYEPGESGVAFVRQAVRWTALRSRDAWKDLVSINTVKKQFAAPPPYEEICVTSLLSTLPEKQRLVLEAYSNGISLREYATANNLNLETVNSRFKLGINKLKQECVA